MGSRTALLSVELPARDRGSGACSVSMARAVVALRGAIAPGFCPVLRYSERVGGAFLGSCTRAFFSGPANSERWGGV